MKPNKTVGTRMVKVCPLHFKEVVSHETREKDGTIKVGFHCPKCFIQNNFLTLELQGELPK